MGRGNPIIWSKEAGGALETFCIRSDDYYASEENHENLDDDELEFLNQMSNIYDDFFDSIRVDYYSNSSNNNGEFVSKNYKDLNIYHDANKNIIWVNDYELSVVCEESSIWFSLLDRDYREYDNTDLECERYLSTFKLFLHYLIDWLKFPVRFRGGSWITGIYVDPEKLDDIKFDLTLYDN